MAGRGRAPARRRRIALARAFLRFGPPTIGLFLIGHAVVISIGGDIEHWQFALGILLILAGFSAQLLPKP